MPRQPVSSLNFWIDNFFPWIALAILLAYTYAFFFLFPYVGFNLDPSDVTVDSFFIEAQLRGGLQVGDRLIKVGEVKVSDYLTHIDQALFDKVEPGQFVPILVQRGMEEFVVRWTIPGPNPREIQYRLIHYWWLAYVFWICAIVVKFSVRPKDSEWRLLIILFFLTGIWLISGIVSQSSIWQSPMVFRSAVWLSLPVLLHLHWIMPKPLGRIPDLWLWFGYSTSFALSIAEWLLILPAYAYIYGVALGFVVGGILLGLHYKFQPALRNELKILSLAFVVAIFPLVVVSLARTIASYPSAGGFGAFGLPALPLAYFYVISNKKSDSLELRANRLISIYIFLALLGVVLFTIVLLLAGLFNASASPLFLYIAVAVLSGLFAVLAFPRFERWMDHSIFGIKLLPADIIEEYSSRISTSLDVNSIEHLLKEKFLPSLFIRQSALLHFERNDSVSLIYTDGIQSLKLPEGEEIEQLWAASGRYLPPKNGSSSPYLVPWMRLALPMQVGDRRVGLWLLGQRDPDDFYSQVEISSLQNIANQTAIALVNAEQAARLLALHQANIERYEEERLRLASDLHDEVLNQLAVLSLNMDGEHPQAVEERFQAVNDRLRRMISSLRPAMLNYGLQAGLEELVDEISERSPSSVQIRLEVSRSQARYDPKVEGHLFRIVQQATENAVRHSEATTIRIYGEIRNESASLHIEDDGNGIPDLDRLNFEHFLERRHFGLARMFERAAIIGADLQIHSKPGSGTRVSVEWTSNRSPQSVRV